MSKHTEFLLRYFRYRGYYGIKQDAPIKFEGVRKKTYGETPEEVAFTCTAITQDDKLLASVSDGKIVLEREALWAIVNHPATVYLLEQSLKELGEIKHEKQDLERRFNALSGDAYRLRNTVEANEHKVLELRIDLAKEKSRVKELEAKLTAIISNGLKGTPITLESDNMRFTIEFQDEQS